MSLNNTPSGDRIHIGFFGRRNAGKSSVVNAVTGQELCIVSDTKGTTTDPVQKAMELLPLGPVVIIDTPGFDDERWEPVRLMPAPGGEPVCRLMPPVRKAREVRLRISEAVGAIDKAFLKQLEALDAYRFLDLESEMDVLRDMLRADGLVDDEDKEQDDPFASVLSGR